MKKFILSIIGLVSLSLSSNAASFLDGVSLTTEGYYKADISNGGGEWGAGSTLGLALNSQKTVTLNVRNLALQKETFGGGPAIDESQAGFSFQLLQTLNKKLTLSGEVDYCRNWESSDNGVGVGGNLNWAFTKNVSAFGGVQYRVWNKGANDMLYPFGIKFSF